MYILYHDKKDLFICFWVANDVIWCGICNSFCIWNNSYKLYFLFVGFNNKHQLGITTFIFNTALILIQFIILRSKFHKKRLLQLINCVLFGYFSDLALNTVSLIPFDGSIEMSILFLILSIFLTALGIFVYMPADIAPLPGEGCVEAIAIVSGWRFSTIKIAFDVVMVMISLIMCGLWYTNILGAVNIGTVISAFMVGFTLRQINNLHAYITGSEIKVANK